MDAYNNVLFNRFNNAWNQPTAEAQAGYKLTTAIKIVIAGDGTISDFSMVRSSGSNTVDESVKAAVSSVTRLPAPPTGRSYTVTINFVLGDN